MMPQDHGLSALIGVPFPSGTWSLPRYQSWLTSHAVYADPEGPPHPINAFIGVQRGLGMTVAELFSYLQSDIDDGPLLLESSINFPGCLRTDCAYTVTGTVTAAERKRGRQLGAFDRVTCQFDLCDDAELVARVTNVYALPRREGQQ